MNSYLVDIDKASINVSFKSDVGSSSSISVGNLQFNELDKLALLRVVLARIWLSIEGTEDLA